MIIGFVVPVILFVWCCAFWTTKRKSKNASLEELKNFYWMKNSNGNEEIEEKTYDSQEVMARVIIGIIAIFLGVIFLQDVSKWNFSAFKSFNEDVFGDILEIDIGILAVISLVTVVNKAYYLGITAKDVMRVYKIPTLVITVWGSSGIAIFFYITSIIITDEMYSIFSTLLIYSSIVFMVINLMILIYRTVIICISNSKKEMKTFKCLRYKLAYGYWLKPDEAINSNAVEKISVYLVNEIKKYYKKFKEESAELVEVEYGSTILLMKDERKEAKKYNAKLRKDGTVLALIFSIYIFLCVFGGTHEINGETKRVWIIIQIVLTVIVIGLGAVTNVWNIVVANRSFWVFKYEKKRKTGKKNGEGLRNEKIAASGFGILYNKQYNFIGAIEDLASFYKILLYNKQGKKVVDIIIRQVEEKIREEEKIKNAILLLLCYFNYEKYYLKNEVKVDRKIKEKDRIEAVRKKTEQKIDKNKIYDYDEMKIWMKNISRESVEYQLADSILKEAYKEPEIKENGEINPEKLKNYKFEYYFDFISSKMENSCSKDKQKNENSNSGEKSNLAEAIK